MPKKIAASSRRIIDDVWNAENHAAALELVPDDFCIDDNVVSSKRKGPLLLLDLLHLYKACAPDLRFSVRRQLITRHYVATFWSAVGRYSCRELGHARLGRRIRLEGAFVAGSTPAGQLQVLNNHWDCGTFISSIGASEEEFAEALRPSVNDIRVRVLPGRPGPPLVLFPTLSLPGWIGWKRFLRKYEGRSDLATFQLLGNRWTLEGRETVKGYTVRTETRAIEKSFHKRRLSMPFDLVAHSAGCCFAIDFALRNPSAIRTLTLIEPVLPWVLRDAGAMDAELNSYIERRMRLYRAGINENQYARFIQETMAPGRGVDPRQSPYWPDVAIYRENMKFRTAIYKHRDHVARLKEVTFPVLLVRGRASDRFHSRTIDVLESSIPSSRSVIMHGGHSPHLGHGLVPFIRHLSRFLDEAPGFPRKTRIRR